VRKVKIITVEGRGEVTVKEVSPLGVWNASQGKGTWLETLKTMADDAVSPAVTEIATWYPSEIEQVVEAFMEVNSSFFVIARRLKVDGLFEELSRDLASNFQLLFADSSRAAMVQLLGTMDGPSSFSPSNP
jgi:hypothetical protein